MRLFLIFIAALYLGVLALIYFFQRDLQYFPGRTDSNPLAAGLRGVERLTLRTGDGESVIAWHARAPQGRPTVLYFHGNAGSLDSRPRRLQSLIDNRFGFLALEYRGYGASSGSPSETGLMLDAKAAYEHLIEAGLKPQDIVISGESLGSGVAVQLAAAHPIAAVSLQAPYAAAVDIGAQRYWFLPVRWLMKDQFRSIDHIGKVKAPLLMIHGEHDQTIPFAQGQKLFAAANQPKEFVAVPHAGHEIIGMEETWAAEAGFFNRAVQVR